MDLSCVSQSLAQHSLPPLNECLLPLLSKLMGFFLAALKSGYKVSQISLIVKSESIEGLSIPSFELEVIGFTIALGYCMFKELACTDYGELAFLLLQSVTLVGLVYYYSPSGRGAWVKSGLYFAITSVLLAGRVDSMLFEALYACQDLIFLVSKILQIRENFENKSTGQLSFGTNIAPLIGLTGQLFRNFRGKAPLSTIIGCLPGILINGIVVWQFRIYKGNQPKKTHNVA